MQRLGRRRLLASVGTAAATGLAGCGGGEPAVPPSERGPLEVAEFAFASGEPEGAGEYETQPERTYTQGGTVWLYTELGGLAAEPLDSSDRVRIDLQEHVTVVGPGGEDLLDDDYRFRDRLAPEQLGRFYVTNDFGLAPATETGVYDVSLRFTDAVSGTEATVSETFTVVE